MRNPIENVRTKASHRSGRRLRLETLERRNLLAAAPIISEFVAVNDNGIQDEDGQRNDWIEILNTGDESIDLYDWALTDEDTLGDGTGDPLPKWRFPSIELGAGDYLVVFASGKDRNDPLSELHANFRLDGAGEYLALVDPAGVAVSAFAPAFPVQVADVSFGIPTGLVTAELISEGDSARVHIPTDASLDPADPNDPATIADSWLDPDLDTLPPNWFDAATGIGFAGTPEAPMVVVADSVAEFSGTQGQDNWQYGVWSHPISQVNDTYASSKFDLLSSTTYWNGTEWTFASIGFPTRITADGGHPMGTPGIHWAIRRWVSEVDGPIKIVGTLADDDPAGDGAVGRIFVNDTEVYNQPIDNNSFDFSIEVTVAAGDTVDLVIDPGAAPDHVGDATTFTAQIRAPGVLEPTRIADSIFDWSPTGTQGNAGWFYGYYNRTADADSTFQVDDFLQFDPGFWTGDAWDWPAGNPPWTFIGREATHPNGTNSGDEHWTIRRYQSEISGQLTVDWNLAKANTNGSGEDGVTGRVLHNGVEVDAATIAFNDTVGVSRTVVIPNVQIGDFIDFAHDPAGFDGVPRDGSDSSNLSAVIYGQPGIGMEIATDVTDAMQNVGTSLYARFPFTVDDPALIDTLTLQMKYDAGFVAYLNGRPVAGRNAPATPAFDSVATLERDVIDAVQFEAVNISNNKSLLNTGTNLLAIHGLNTTADDSNFLMSVELVAGSLTIDPNNARYFMLPSPGEANDAGTDEVGPLFIEAGYSPNTPGMAAGTAEPIVVTARLTPTFDPVDSVTLRYRVMYGSENLLAMYDDGFAPDAVAGDGIYTATIADYGAQPGEMVRWYFTADDTEGRQTKFPAFASPLDSEQYRGTMVADATVNGNLPVIYWFVENPSAANNRTGTRGSLFYDGEFYDNVQFDLHGQSSAGFPKKSYDVDFTRDHRFRLSDDYRRMKDFDLLTNYADKAKLRNTLAYEIRAATGSGYHLAFPVRIEQNGQFFGVYDFVEDGDDRWLDRIGLDGDGAMYKMYDGMYSTGQGEKKTRKTEDKSDLQALIDGVKLTGQAKINYIMDNVNVPAMANYLAGFAATSNRDCCHKNYYAYRDTNGTGEWWYLPWDVDLSLGRNWGGFGLGYHDYTIYANNGLYTGGTNNALIGALLNNVPGFDDMYLTRVRTLMDELYGPPGQAYEDRYLESRVDFWAAQIGDVAAPGGEGDGDAKADHDKWGQVSSALEQQPFETWPEAVAKLKDEYLEPRRQYYVDTLLPMLPGGQLEQVTLLDETNRATAIVPGDGSLGTSWRQIGFDDALWPSGSDGVGYERGSGYGDWIGLDVLPAIDVDGNGTNESNTFYARWQFDVADPAALESLTLRMRYDDGFVAYLNGTEVKRVNFAGTPSWNSSSDVSSGEAANFVDYVVGEYLGLLQSGENILAIQGLNVGPTSSDMLVQPRLLATQVGAEPVIDIQFGTIEFNPAGGNQDEEYVELVNNGTTPIDVSGWQLAGGVDHTFQPGTVLPAGFRVYVSPNVNAFRARASGPSGGQGLFIQGNYGGHLSNFGETIQLLNGQGELVADTTYIGQPTDAQLFLRIDEIMFNPPGLSPQETLDGFIDPDQFEFIELVNTSTDTALDLTGVRFTNGVEFDFTGSAATSLAAGERVLVVRDLAAMKYRYGEAIETLIAGQYIGGLKNDGEGVKLEDATNSTVAEFTYKDGPKWPQTADGGGSSLVAISADAAPDSPQGWHASVQTGGSPGESPLPLAVARHVFYDGSSFDAGGAEGDDAAIAADKTALLPGQTATAANFTNYGGGVNGLMIDLAHAPRETPIDEFDFAFAVGNAGTPAAWQTIAAPSIAVRPGQGRGGSDRVVLAWTEADSAPQNTWLQVTVLSDANGGSLGLAGNDVFYFGNAIGEVTTLGTPGSLGAGLPTVAFTNAADVIAIRDNPRGPANPASLGNPFDVNRDGRVDALDLILARDFATSPLSALRLLTP